jgi:hypothetical protein
MIVLWNKRQFANTCEYRREMGVYTGIALRPLHPIVFHDLNILVPPKYVPVLPPLGGTQYCSMLFAQEGIAKPLFLASSVLTF